MMRLYRKTLSLAGAFGLSLILLMTGMGTAWAEIDGLSSAINKAGRQRMLTQRIVKAYILVGLNVQKSRHIKQLKSAIKLFDTQLSELKAFATAADVQDGLRTVEALWTPFKEAAGTDVSKAGAETLLSMDGELLAAAHQVVLMLEKQAGTPAGRLVNLAGRQRMLSQRLAKFYMARAWGVAGGNTVELMRAAAGEFDDALMTELIVSDQNTVDIQTELNNAKKQWQLYKRGLQLEADSGDYIPVIMALNSEKLLKMMNKITVMYAKLG